MVIVTKVPRVAREFSFFLEPEEDGRPQDLTSTILSMEDPEEEVVLDLFTGIPDWQWTAEQIKENSPFRFPGPEGGRVGKRFLTLSSQFRKQFLQTEDHVNGLLVIGPVALALVNLSRAVLKERAITIGPGLTVTPEPEEVAGEILAALANLREVLVSSPGGVGLIEELAQAAFGGHLNQATGKMERRRPGSQVVLQRCKAVPKGHFVPHPSLFRYLFETLWERRLDFRRPLGPEPRNEHEDMLASDLPEFFGQFPWQALIHPDTATCLKGDDDGDIAFLIRWLLEALALRYPLTPDGEGQGGVQPVRPWLPTEDWVASLWAQLELEGGLPQGLPVVFDHSGGEGGLDTMIRAAEKVMSIKRAMGPTEQQATQVVRLNPKVKQGHRAAKEGGVEKTEIDPEAFVAMKARSAAAVGNPTFVEALFRRVTFDQDRPPSLQEVVMFIVSNHFRPPLPGNEIRVNLEVTALTAALTGFHEFTEADMAGLRLLIRLFQAIPPGAIRDQSAALNLLHTATVVRSVQRRAAAQGPSTDDPEEEMDDPPAQAQQRPISLLSDMVEERGAHWVVERAKHELLDGLTQEELRAGWKKGVENED